MERMCEARSNDRAYCVDCRKRRAVIDRAYNCFRAMPTVVFRSSGC